MFALRQIMTPWPSFLSADMTLLEASRVMADRDLRTMPVCAPDRTFEGVLNARDLSRAVTRGKDPAIATIGELVHPMDAPSVDIDDPLDVVLFAMRVHDVRRMYVVEDGKLVGIVSLTDLARACPPERMRQVVAQVA